MLILKGRLVPAAAAALATAGFFGAPALAATLIDGKRIKSNSITSRQVKNGSLTARDLTPGTHAQLKGEQGPPGANGGQGPQGERGFPGPQGPAGSQGAAGPQGPTGPQGPKGDVTTVSGNSIVGPQGPRGDRGPEGPKGEPGPAGSAGPVGPAGAKGDPGPAGPAGVADVKVAFDTIGPVPPSETRGMYAVCPAGYAAVNGGMDASPRPTIVTSGWPTFPDGNGTKEPNGWVTQIHNSGEDSFGPVGIYAICVK